MNYYYRDCQNNRLENRGPRIRDYIGAAVMGAVLGAMLAVGALGGIEAVFRGL